mgnify:CR=1 FL=1
MMATPQREPGGQIQIELRTHAVSLLLAVHAQDPRSVELLRRSSQQLLNAQEAERQRIAYELCTTKALPGLTR